MVYDSRYRVVLGIKHMSGEVWAELSEISNYCGVDAMAVLAGHHFVLHKLCLIASTEMLCKEGLLSYSIYCQAQP